MSVRKPVFAGTWYPAGADECRQMIESFLKEPRFRIELDSQAAGGIVPHAGWPFSGDLACRVVSCIRGEPESPEPDVVAVFGGHLPPGAQPHAMIRGGWQTPFGVIQTAEELAEAVAARFKCRIETADSFTPDNTIELQLPFVKYFFKNAGLLPIGVPPSETAEEIGKYTVREAERQGLKIKVLGSTDLTHYGPGFGFTPAGTGRQAYEWVKNKNDKQVIDRMLEMDPAGVINEGLSNHNACCPGAAAAAIAAAAALGANRAGLAGYSSSYEKNPDSTFVGYGGVVYTF